MLYVKLALHGSGFTNQIFSLISGIILGIYKKHILFYNKIITSFFVK